MGFADKLAGLPPADHLARIELEGPQGETAVIENRPGSQGSLRIYHHLAQKFAAIDAAAATEGLALFAEHTADARAHPGKHPNIDRLLQVQADGHAWSARLIPQATP